VEVLTPSQLLFFSAVIVVSYAIRGTAGFGGVTVPLLAWILSIKVIALMVTMLGLVSSAAILLRDWRHVVWKDIWPLMPWCLLGVGTGLYFFNSLDETTLTRGLAAFVIGYGFWSLLCSYRAHPGARVPPRAAPAIAGATGGFVGTLFGTNAGMFFAIYLNMLGHGKLAFRATVAAALFALGLLRGGGYLSVGAVDREALLVCTAGLPLMLAGVFLGDRIHARINERMFTRMVALILVGSGVPLLLR